MAPFTQGYRVPDTVPRDSCVLTHPVLTVLQTKALIFWISEMETAAQGN